MSPQSIMLINQAADWNVAGAHPDEARPSLAGRLITMRTRGQRRPDAAAAAATG